MASENKNENVMLTGNTAYFKKNGSMVNHGTIELPDGNTARSYTEGYVGPNSVIHGTDLEDIAEYTECETAMRTYMGDDWETETDSYTIVTNANKISNMLLNDELYIQSLESSVQLQGDKLNYIYATSNYTDTSSSTTYYYHKAIDLGINANDVYGIEFEFAPYSTTTSTYDNSSYLSGLLDNFTIGKHGNTSTEIYLRHRGAEKFVNGTVTTDTTFNTIKILNNECLINGVQKCTLDTTVPISTSDKHLILFSNSAFSRWSVMYFKRLKLYGADNTTLLADIIPARNTIGDIGVWDNIRKRFYHNVGSSEFSYGHVIDDLRVELEYALKNTNVIIPIYGSGSTFKYKFAKSINGFELDFMPMEDFTVSGDTSEKHLFQLNSGTSTTSYGNMNTYICSMPGYGHGAIVVNGTTINAKMLPEHRMTISIKNGVLTLPDGSTQNVSMSDTSYGVYIGGNKSGKKSSTTSDRYAKLRIYKLRLYNGNNLVEEFVPVEDHDGIVQLYANVEDMMETSYTGNTLKAGPIKNN